MDNNINEDYTNYVNNFLSLGNDYFVSWINITSFLTSSILIDAYLVRMHSKPLHPRYIIASYNFIEFKPKAVFRRLYKPYYIAVIIEVINSPEFAKDLYVYLEE